MRIRQGEQLRLILASAVATQVFATARIRYDNGQYQDLDVLEKTTGSSRATETFTSETVASANGEVVSSIAFVRTTATKPGQLYAGLYVANGDRLLQALCKGYIYDGHDVSMGEFQLPGEGPGTLRHLTTANPAANAEVEATAVPTNARWKLVAFMVSMVQGVTDTPRPAVLVQTAAGALIIGLFPLGADVAASTTVRCTWARGLGAGEDNNVTGGSLSASLPDLTLDELDEILTSTQGLGANSDYGAAEIFVEEWVIL